VAILKISGCKVAIENFLFDYFIAQSMIGPSYPNQPHSFVRAGLHFNWCDYVDCYHSTLRVRFETFLVFNVFDFVA